MARQHPSRRPKAITLTCALAAVAAALALVPGAAAACANNTLPGTNPQTDAVNDWSKTCDEAKNWVCKDCELWNDYSRPANKSGDKFAYSGSGPGKSYRGKILPSAPVTGIDAVFAAKFHDPVDKATYFLWSKALTDVVTTGVLHKIDKTTRPIAYINSLVARTQHQMHIHVGKAKNDDWYNCAKTFINNPPTPALKWSPSYTSTACTDLHAGGYPVSLIATTAGPNDVNRAIRTGLDQMMGGPGKDIKTNPVGMHSGVLVMPVKGSTNLLVFIVSGTNDYKIFGDKP